MVLKIKLKIALWRSQQLRRHTDRKTLTTWTQCQRSCWHPRNLAGTAVIDHTGIVSAWSLTTYMSGYSRTPKENLEGFSLTLKGQSDKIMYLLRFTYQTLADSNNYNIWKFRVLLDVDNAKTQISTLLSNFLTKTKKCVKLS